MQASVSLILCNRDGLFTYEEGSVFDYIVSSDDSQMRYCHSVVTLFFFIILPSVRLLMLSPHSEYEASKKKKKCIVQNFLDW